MGNKFVYILHLWEKAIIISVFFYIGYHFGGLLLRSFSPGGLTDFHVYYYIPKAIMNLARPEAPYTNFVPIHPYFFPPGSMILFKPILLLPFYQAKIVWTMLNFCLFIISFYLINKMAGGNYYAGLIICLLAGFFFFPFQFTILDGQFNIVLLFLLSGSLYSYLSKKNGSSGVLLGIGTITKISPFLLVLYAFWKKRYTTVLLSIVIILVFSALAEIYVKNGVNFYYFRHVVNKVSTQSDGGWTDQSLLGFIKSVNVDLPVFHIFGPVLTEDVMKSLVSYVIVGSALIGFLLVDLRKRKSKVGSIVDYSILISIGIIGTGLTWYHQYTMFLLPILCLFFISVFWIKKKYSILFLSLVLVVYLIINQYLGGKAVGPLHKNMFFGGVLLIFLYMTLKSKPDLVRLKMFDTPLKKIELRKKYFYVVSLIFAAGVIAGIQPGELSEKLKEYRDSSRIQQINYMGNVLDETRPHYVIGESNSSIRTEKLDEGYILFAYDEHNKVREKMSILYLDPVNDKTYNYIFRSENGQTFSLNAKMESNKYINIYGEYYEYETNK